MVFGRFEEALKLALAAPYEFDRAEAKREKATLRDTGATGRRVKAKLPTGHARSLVDYLVAHPTDFKGAVARLRPELQGLYLSAYQSYLWNRMLAAWLRDTIPAGRTSATVELKLGRVPVPLRVPDGDAGRVGVADAAAAVGAVEARAGGGVVPRSRRGARGGGADAGGAEGARGCRSRSSRRATGPRASARRSLADTPATDELNAGRRKLTLRVRPAARQLRDDAREADHGEPAARLPRHQVP